MKICSRLKKIFLEDEPEIWQKINRILIRAIILNTAIFFCLIIALVFRHRNFPIDYQTLDQPVLASEEKEILFNIGGRVFNLSRQILDNHKKSKLYMYYLNSLSKSDIWVPRNPQLFDFIYEYLVLGSVNTEKLSPRNLTDLLDETIYFNLGELSIKLNSIIQLKPSPKKQKSLIKLVRSLRKIFF